VTGGEIEAGRAMMPCREMPVPTKETIMNETKQTDIRIVVLPRGWVVVGDYAEAAGKVTLTRSMVIRRWGTTDGLGQ
jgi:hypothetical protein